MEELRERIYSQWEWNYGHSPACSIRKERRVEGCGTLQIHMDVEKGNITRLAFRGDYFAREGQRRTGGVPSGNSAGGRRSSAGIERLAGGGLILCVWTWIPLCLLCCNKALRKRKPEFAETG